MLSIVVLIIECVSSVVFLVLFISSKKHWKTWITIRCFLYLVLILWLAYNVYHYQTGSVQLICSILLLVTFVGVATGLVLNFDSKSFSFKSFLSLIWLIPVTITLIGISLSSVETSNNDPESPVDDNDKQQQKTQTKNTTDNISQQQKTFYIPYSRFVVGTLPQKNSNHLSVEISMEENDPVLQLINSRSIDIIMLVCPQGADVDSYISWITGRIFIEDMTNISIDEVTMSDMERLSKSVLTLGIILKNPKIEDYIKNKQIYAFQISDSEAKTAEKLLFISKGLLMSPSNYNQIFHNVYYSNKLSS